MTQKNPETAKRFIRKLLGQGCAIAFKVKNKAARMTCWGIRYPYNPATIDLLVKKDWHTGKYKLIRRPL